MKQIKQNKAKRSKSTIEKQRAKQTNSSRKKGKLFSTRHEMDNSFSCFVTFYFLFLFLHAKKMCMGNPARDGGRVMVFSFHGNVHWQTVDGGSFSLSRENVVKT